jgi:predicted PurR-regulated permease PerM
MAGTLVGGILSVTTSVVGSIVSVIFIVSMLVIFLGDGAQVEGYVLSLVSVRYRERVKGVMDRIGTRSGGWLVGQLSLMLAMGLGAFIILTVLGVPGATVLALVTALFELIPAIGPMIAVIPAALVAFAQPPLLALAVVALYFVMHQVESAVLVPNLMGRSVHLHPLAVLIAVIAFTSLFGVLGAVIAPATAVAVDEILREWRARMDAASDVATPSVAPAEQRIH